MIDDLFPLAVFGKRRYEKDFRAARIRLVHGVHGFLRHALLRDDRHDRRLFIDERKRTVFEFPCGIALARDIRNFFEFQTAFRGNKTVGAAP